MLPFKHGLIGNKLFGKTFLITAFFITKYMSIVDDPENKKNIQIICNPIAVGNHQL